ncbi:hypothetical protein AB4059_00350 [Lysobacter sp. 2RAF19]
MNIVITVIAIVIAVAALVGQRAMQRDALRNSFQAQTFDTPEGKVDGRSLQVVKIASLAATTPNSVEGFDTQTRDEFWYCVGPGPSYFLAIPTIGVRYGSVAFVRWVVRPLSEERMRGALRGDRRATKLAFGEAIDA